jgi:hypothetical protein
VAADSPIVLARVKRQRDGTLCNCQILKIDALFVNVEGAHSSPAETPVDAFV